MPTIQLPIQNFAKQQLIFDSTARINLIKKGRRFGFTKGAANNTVKIGLTGKKKKGLWVDTVNSNIERYVERYFIPSLRKLPTGMWKWQKQQKVLHIRDFYMDFRSVDNPENIEGFDYDYLILNEAGIILKDPYLWENAIRPMMWERSCQAFIGGTPKLGCRVFEELYQRGLVKDQDEFKSFSFSSFDNPFIPHDIIRQDMETMSERGIQQEVYGEFLDDTGVVFRGVKAIAVLDPKADCEPIYGHMYVMGVDVAKLMDYTVIAVYDRTTNRQVFQMRFKDLEWPVIRQRVVQVSRKYNNALIYLDSTGVGEPLYDDLTRLNVPVEGFHFTNEFKKQMIEKLSTFIELQYLRMLNIDDTINELNTFTYDYSEKTNRVIYGAPVGMHDDIVIAHSLAVWGLTPVRMVEPVESMSIIRQDILRKTGQLDEQQDDFEELDGWGLYGE